MNNSHTYTQTNTHIEDREFNGKNNNILIWKYHEKKVMNEIFLKYFVVICIIILVSILIFSLTFIYQLNLI